MRFELWNKIIKEFFVAENNENEIFINVDKDTLVEYVIGTGVLKDSIIQIQNFQIERDGRAQSEESIVWQDFIRLFRAEKATKDAFLNKMI